MGVKNEQNWHENYESLKQYITEHHHLPNKRVVENRGLLNWWKYNQKLIKQGKLAPERIELLKVLSEMRWTK
ncbi:MAG: helicase associated domain-containing protein [Bacteroides sp.]